MRILLPAPLTAAVFAAATFLGGATPSAVAEAAEKTVHVIEIHKFEFVPAQLVVEPGDTITWELLPERAYVLPPAPAAEAAAG